MDKWTASQSHILCLSRSSEACKEDTCPKRQRNDEWSSHQVKFNFDYKKVLLVEDRGTHCVIAHADVRSVFEEASILTGPALGNIRQHQRPLPRSPAFGCVVVGFPFFPGPAWPPHPEHWQSSYCLQHLQQKQNTSCNTARKSMKIMHD